MLFPAPTKFKKKKKKGKGWNITLIKVIQFPYHYWFMVFRTCSIQRSVSHWQFSIFTIGRIQLGSFCLANLLMDCYYLSIPTIFSFKSFLKRGEWENEEDIPIFNYRLLHCSFYIKECSSSQCFCSLLYSFILLKMSTLFPPPRKKYGYKSISIYCIRKLRTFKTFHFKVMNSEHKSHIKKLYSKSRKH